jgi:hypothetical protein
MRQFALSYFAPLKNSVVDWKVTHLIPTDSSRPFSPSQTSESSSTTNTIESVSEVIVISMDRSNLGWAPGIIDKAFPFRSKLQLATFKHPAVSNGTPLRHKLDQDERTNFGAPKQSLCQNGCHAGSSDRTRADWRPLSLCQTTVTISPFGLELTFRNVCY